MLQRQLGKEQHCDLLVAVERSLTTPSPIRNYTLINLTLSDLYTLLISPREEQLRASVQCLPPAVSCPRAACRAPHQSREIVQLCNVRQNTLYS